MLSLRSLYVFIICLLICKLIAQCPVSSLSFNTQAQIDSFPIKYPDCSNLGPIGLNIRETLSGDITSLLPFKQLKGKQKAEIFIVGNINLTSLEGFNNIDTLENSMLVKGNSIKDISALSKLRYCKWSLTFDEDSLTDLKGLENLTSAFQLSFLNRSERTISLKSLSSLRKLNNFFILGNYLFENISFKWVKDMRIRADNSLSSLEGIKVDSLLEQLSIHTPIDFSFEGNDRPKKILKLFIFGDTTKALSFKGIEKNKEIQELILFDFESLSDLDYFKDTKIISRLHFENISKFPKNIFLEKSSIDSIDLLELVNLDSLVNLDGLEDIYELSGIMLSGNKNLENILALSNAKTTAAYKHVFYPNKQYTLVLKNNPKLSYCQIAPICKMLSELPAQKFIVQGNYEDCEHSEALLDACELVDVNDDLLEHCFFLYPNPTSNYIYANFCERINEFEIFDESGVLIRKGIPNENGLNEIYIADLAKGYFLFRAILKNGKPITKGFVIR